MDKNAKNPKYWSKSNMVYAFVLRYKYTIRKIVLQHKILDLFIKIQTDFVGF